MLIISEPGAGAVYLGPPNNRRTTISSTVPRLLSVPLYSPPGEQIKNKQDKRDEQNNMQKPAERISTDKPQGPENDENNDDGPHNDLSSQYVR